MKKIITYIVLVVASYSVHGANLLTNPGFEDGLNNWTNYNGLAGIKSNNPTAHGGTSYVYGPDTPFFSIWQRIELADFGFTDSEIDAGNLQVTYGGWQSGFGPQTDHGEISLTFIDENEDKYVADILPSFYSSHTWVEQTGTRTLDAGTRAVLIQFSGYRDQGIENNAHFDDAYLSISTIPVPSTILLIMIGLFGVFTTNKMRKS
jgi:hypothetical protein